jgi:DNA-binding LytR/AlgR family response regulator
MILKCAIVDDEPLARECIEGYVKQIEFLDCVAIRSSALELSQLISETEIDLVFLDIQIPYMTGIDFLKKSPNTPMVIITTAYPNYALEGFQLDVMDYLLKPITFSRFLKAVNKANDYQNLVKHSVDNSINPSSDSDYFFIKCDYKYEKILFGDIIYVQALQNYVTIHTDQGKFTTLLPLKTVEKKLVGRDFIRTHKSYLVSILRIESIEQDEIVIQSARIPISRNYKEGVIKKVVSNNLWTKSASTQNGSNG